MLAQRDSLDCVPIVFLYRQALELNLKSVIINSNRLLRLHREEPVADDQIFSTHVLPELFKPAQKIIKYMEWKQHYKGCQQIIDAFHQIDPGSYAFRYPIDTKGKASVERHFTFDVSIFVAQLDPIIGLLSNTASQLDYIVDKTAEWLAEQQSEAAEAKYFDGPIDDWDQGDYEPPDHDGGDYDSGDYEPEEPDPWD